MVDHIINNSHLYNNAHVGIHRFDVCVSSRSHPVPRRVRACVDTSRKTYVRRDSPVLRTPCASLTRSILRAGTLPGKAIKQCALASYSSLSRFPYKGPFKCYIMLVSRKFDPHPPPRNANNIEQCTFIMLFPRKMVKDSQQNRTGGQKCWVSCIFMILGNFMETITLPSKTEHLFTYQPH